MKVSPQGGVFIATHAAAIVVELLAEISLDKLLPPDDKAAHTRFWAQYVASTAIVILIGVVGFWITEALARCGHGWLAWGVCALPSIALLTGMFVLRGSDTVLMASSGTGNIALIKAAYAAKREKKCDPA